MPTASPAAPPATWTPTALQAVVLDLLAELLMEDREELEQRLSVTPAMPVDSLDMMDIIAGFKQRTGLSVDKVRSADSYSRYRVASCHGPAHPGSMLRFDELLSRTTRLPASLSASSASFTPV